MLSPRVLRAPAPAVRDDRRMHLQKRTVLPDVAVTTTLQPRVCVLRAESDQLLGELGFEK
jgi:hypothetical protein